MPISSLGIRKSEPKNGSCICKVARLSPKVSAVLKNIASFSKTGYGMTFYPTSLAYHGQNYKLELRGITPCQQKP